MAHPEGQAGAEADSTVSNDSRAVAGGSGQTAPTDAHRAAATTITRQAERDGRIGLAFLTISFGLGVALFIGALLGWVWAWVAGAIAFFLWVASRQPVKPVKPGRRRPNRAMREVVHRRDGGRCRHCGSDFDIQYDHILPVSRGGETTVENLQLLCGRCN